MSASTLELVIVLKIRVHAGWVVNVKLGEPSCGTKLHEDHGCSDALNF